MSAYNKFYSNFKHNSGFTLIELMIAIGIIGILAAIAIPKYQNHIIKTQLNRAYYELRSSITAIEAVLAAGHMPTLDINQDNKIVNGIFYEYIGLDSTKAISNILNHATIQTDNHHFSSISAQLDGQVSPKLNGTVISLNRSLAGTWNCEIKPTRNATDTALFNTGGCTITQQIDQTN